MQLFRGDKIFNEKTKPGLYRNNGLRSKAFGSGSNPENIELTGLLESIRRHIRPINNSDIEYYDVTDYLSFSESRERALYWCRDKDSLIIDKVDDYKETRYLFILQIDDSYIRKIGDGICMYYYSCNPKLKASDSGEEPHVSALRLVHNNEICQICNNQNKTHRIILINSYEYLTKNAKQAKYNGAMEFAKKDMEWLVLPFDPMGKHRSSRIQRADFWFAEHYKAVGEKRPTLDYI